MAGENIRIKDLPVNGSPNPNQLVATDLTVTQRLTIQDLVNTGSPIASQSEAQTGTNATKRMTPLTTKQSIASEVGVTLATANQGLKADTALQEDEVATVALTGQASDLSGAGVVGLNVLASTTQAQAVAAIGVDTSNFLVFTSGLVANWNGTTGTDNITVLQAALDTGFNVYIPPGKYAYSGLLRLTKPNQAVISPGAEFYWLGRPGNTAFLMAVIDPAAVNSRFEGILFDHRCQNWTQPTSGPGMNIALCSAVMAMADNSGFENCEVRNAWDNGFALGQYDYLGTGNQTNSRPQSPFVRRGVSRNCGKGFRLPDGQGRIGQAGGGVNNLTAAGAIISDCVDYESNSNFIIDDYAAGATSVATNIIGYDAKVAVSPNGTIPLDDGGQPFGGLGVYQSGKSSAVNIQIFNPQGTGVWQDAYAYECQNSNVLVQGGARRGFLLSGRNNQNVNIKAIDCSTGNTGVYDAIEVVGKQDAGIPNLADSRAMQIIGAVTAGTSHRHGLSVIKSGTLKAIGFASSIQVNANSGGKPVNNECRDTFHVDSYVNLSAPSAVVSDTVKEVQRKLVSSVAVGVPTGDTVNAHIVFADPDDNRKRLAMGYNDGLLAGVLQSIFLGNYPLPTSINPDGGAVYLGQGQWYHPVRIGQGSLSWYLWVDAAGAKRSKSGSAPTSDGDGVAGW